jgi:signal transduction histidine kinase/CHASE3 domain sensor protein
VNFAWPGSVVDSSIRRTLWGAFAALALLAMVGLALTLTVLQTGKEQEHRIIHGSEPLNDTVNRMDDDTTILISAARGYHLTRGPQFQQQYDSAIRDFYKNAKSAMRLAADPGDVKLVGDLRRHFEKMRELTKQEMDLAQYSHFPEADNKMFEIERVHRSSQDFSGMMLEEHRRRQAAELDRMTSMRLGLSILMVVVTLVILVIAAFTVMRIEQRLAHSISRQIRRTETMIAGMSDGVALIDDEGKTVFINPAGQTLLATSEIGVPIFRHAEVYRLRDESGDPLDAKELPAAQALSTGKTVQDRTVMINRDDRQVAVSMNATPLHEEERITGVIVTFRDITERRLLEENMQVQAERAQILADAGAFFASNIDPAWVTQAIAERVAEVLGDWAAVILKAPDSNELRVASIYHRDMASLGLAWSYIYRQPLVVAEGIIGQVVATGYPSLTQNVGGGPAHDDATSYHVPHMKLASLLILPLRTRREMLGALVIAANDPERAMTDENLPLAEVLAERASLAIENAKLYTEQVDARRKVEDLSRLKDEFLSIASHELRTPVTSIKGYTQLAKTLIRENDLATSEEYLDIALDQIDRMSRLILELLDVSRIETGRLEIRREPIQWAPFVREVVHRHPAGSERALHLSIPDINKEVSGDRDRLEQVLGNLLENAAKYSPDGSDIYVNVEDRGDQMVTSVCDRGIGIPADEIGQVFERFHRGRQVSSTNYGGLGLGLYITKQIVERHGGAIWVDSKERSGTTFFFSLPVVSVATEEEKEPVASSRAG